MAEKLPFYLATLYEMIDSIERDNYNPFGFGIYRWVASWHIAKKLNVPTSKIRYEFDKMAKGGMIDRKKQEGACILYSLKGMEDCEIKGDYFIEKPENLQPHPINN